MELFEPSGAGAGNRLMYLARRTAGTHCADPAAAHCVGRAYSSDAGITSPGRQSHSNITLYISLVIIHTKYTGRRQNDFNVYA